MCSYHVTTTYLVCKTKLSCLHKSRNARGSAKICYFRFGANEGKKGATRKNWLTAYSAGRHGRVRRRKTRVECKTEKCRATSPLVGIIGSSSSFRHDCSHATIIQDMCKIQGASQDNGNEYITVIYLLGSQEGGPPKVHMGRRSTFVD